MLCINVFIYNVCNFKYYILFYLYLYNVYVLKSGLGRAWQGVGPGIVKAWRCDAEIAWHKEIFRDSAIGVFIKIKVFPFRAFLGQGQIGTLTVSPNWET